MARSARPASAPRQGKGVFRVRVEVTQPEEECKLWRPSRLERIHLSKSLAVEKRVAVTANGFVIVVAEVDWGRERLAQRRKAERPAEAQK